MRKIVLSLTGILILSIFVLAGCGSGPQQTSVADTGAYAIDFTTAPGVLGFVALGQPTGGIKSLEDKELTVEAWVRTNQHAVNKTAPPSLRPYGTIFGLGSDFEGIHLLIDGNQQVQFEIQGFPGTSSPADPPNLPKFARSDTVLSETNTWYHIAAVLVNDDHWDGEADDHDCGDNDGDGYEDSSETPHIDIYINGELDNCGSAGATYDPVTEEWSGGFTGPLDFVRSERAVCEPDSTIGVKDVDYVIEDGVCYPLDKHLNKFKFGASIGRSPSDWRRLDSTDEDRITPAERFSGVIDEVRFWNVARTQAEIQANKDKEIEPQDNLIGYWRFNEGSPDAEKGVGNIVVDSSGSGKGGVKMYCNIGIPSGDQIDGEGCSGPVANALPWYEGWVDLEEDTEKNWK